MNDERNNESSPQPVTMNDVAAFADGEADGQTSSRVLRESAHRPEVAVAVLQQQQLRGAVGESITRSSPAMPDDLKAKINGLFDDADAEQSSIAAAKQAEQPAVAGRIGAFQWLPLAIAAMVLVAALLVVNMGNPTTMDTGVVVSPVKAEQFAARHVRCASSIDSLFQSDQFNGKIEEVKNTVLQNTRAEGGSLPSLDLSAAGYEFERAGNCQLPGDSSVHLIYKAMPETGREDRVSLWIRRDAGQLQEQVEKPDKLYLFTPYEAKVGNAAHLMFIWRSGGMVYYLVGDTSRPELEKTANVLLASG